MDRKDRRPRPSLSGLPVSYPMGGEVESEKISSISAMASSQNLPAVLNDPRKGNKQKDFFTKVWGEEFTDATPLPWSGQVMDVPMKAFDKYLRRLRKYRSAPPAAGNAPPSTAQPPFSSGYQSSLAQMPRMFWDPNFNLSDPATFAEVFPFFQKLELSERTSSSAQSGRLVQERLSHHLDAVEVDIAGQVAQKSHHFFEIMTYHDALMKQLESLIKHVQQLRKSLQHVDNKFYKKSLDICRMERRRRNAVSLEEKLAVMSHLHQTQPKIQLLLSGNEFSGALDLITTSRDVLAVDLRGVVSFGHLSSQLHEIQNIIGRMLLGDFQTYISDEIHRNVTHERASVLVERPSVGMEDADSDQLISVIFGLLRQNSYTFLEVLESASITAVKNVFKEVALEILVSDVSKDSDGDKGVSCTTTNLAAEFAKSSSSQEWIDFFDVLLGSLLSLLRRIYAIHSVIVRAIDMTVASNSTVEQATVSSVSTTVIVPEQQLKNLQVTSQEVLVNVCDQVVERSSKILTQRSKAEASKHLSTEELVKMSRFADILNEETCRMTGKISSGFQLSLQGQTLMYIQGFHDKKRLELSDLLEKEQWKKSTQDFNELKSKFADVKELQNFLFSQSIANGKHSDEETKEEGVCDVILAKGRRFSVTLSTQLFLLLLNKYCSLSQTLPYISFELGLKAAELIKFYNSRICQLVLGVGAISVSGLKTITIRNLALAKRSLELIIEVIPVIRTHFETVHVPSIAVNNNENKELKQFDSLRRQFDQAAGHLTNHVKELEDKILNVVEQILQQHLTTWNYLSGSGSHQIPSANFKALCKQLTKLHDSVIDVWPWEDLKKLMVDVHLRFMTSVKVEITSRMLNRAEQVGNGHVGHHNELISEARAFKSELSFYSQSIARLNVIPEDLLSQQYLDAIWSEAS